MIIFIGATIVLCSVIGGYAMAGGHLGALMHLSEFLIIGGAALGALVIMSPRKVLVDLVKLTGRALQGTPFDRKAYEDLLKALYELFLM